ncbi:MAG: hypothetical protein ACI9WV_000622, partial [Patiriisocius sp.]
AKPLWLVKNSAINSTNTLVIVFLPAVFISIVILK